MATHQPITLQQAFDAALFGIRRQNYRQSVDDNGRCKYRGKDDCRCAIGHSLPDELYTANLDFDGGMTASQMIDKPYNSDIRLFYKLCPWSDLNSLQSIHDGMNGPEYRASPDETQDACFERAMRAYAESRGLRYTPVEETPSV